MAESNARSPAIRSNWTENEVAQLQGLKPEKARKKLETINMGGEIAQENEVFPESRSCNDVCWVIVFFAFVAATIGVCAFYGRNLSSFGTSPLEATIAATPNVTNPLVALANPLVAPATPLAAPANPLAAPARMLQAPYYQRPGYTPYSPTGNYTPTAAPDPYAFTQKVKPLFLVLGVGSGCVVSLVAAIALVFLSKSCGKCVVYTSLLFSAALMVVMGISMMAAGGFFGMLYLIFGAIMVLGGICMAVCVMCCWAKFIEFTAQVVTQCAVVTTDNCGMFFVAMVGAFFSCIWSIVVAIAADGTVAQYAEDIAGCQYCGYAVFGSFFFVWLWGCMVASSICYTTFAGVFGKWYYSDDEQLGHNYDSPVCSSLCAATTTSLGSICFGTFLVAFIRTMSFIVRMAEQDAAEDGNIVLCLILCCVRCVLECIGDIIEYFNEWAYVQCAIRGTSFCESAKIVFSLCSVRNIYLIWATLLIDSVVNFGSFLGGFCAAIIAGGIGFIGSKETAMVGGIIGLIAGNAVGWCIMSTFSAGAKTLLTCWAENPATLLHKSHETDLYEKFTEKGSMITPGM